MESALHAAYSVNQGKKVHISRQHLIDCVPRHHKVLNWDGSIMCLSFGCEGCYNDAALGYVIMHGVAHEHAYQYNSLQGQNVNFYCKLT